MKNTFKKIGALALVLVMVLAMSVTAFADGTTLDTNGEQGAFASPDTPLEQEKTLVLEKELKVYNVDENKIKAPTITYNYAIAPATVADGTTVTDNASKHNANAAVTVPVKAGIGTLSATVSWANEELNAGTDGVKNVKDISIDFSSVVFTGPGVYRYSITESLAEGFTYANTGVTETTGNHVRYIDVYVKPAENYNNGSTAAEWVIYGFTCFYNNTSITDANKTTSAVKTTGFVDGTTDGSTTFLADQYYTFNLTISKTVVNDGYGAATVDFPFTVLFTNANVSTGTIVTNGATAPTGTDFTHNTSVDLTSGNLKGVATLKSGQQIKYVGIPNGTSVEVYETNVATGVTYTVVTDKDGTTSSTDNAVIWGTAPASAVAQTTKQDYESTKATLTTTVNSDDDTSHTIAITNTLLVISPTGVVMRVAPYVLILAAGVVLLVLSRKRRNRDEA